MKFIAVTATLALSAALLIAGAGAARAPEAAAGIAAADSYKVDAGHSSIVFRIKHLNISNFYGNFRDFSGTFTADPDTGEVASLSVEVKATSVDTGIDGRDKHLRSPDFFNVDQFPTASFTSTEVKKSGEGKFEATGEFTLCGVTKTVTVPVEFTGAGKDPRGGNRAGVEAVFDFSRDDYGITYMPDGLSKQVRLIVSLSGVKP
jgi:polyisoprenoid-binding protein YceI